MDKRTVIVLALSATLLLIGVWGALRQDDAPSSPAQPRPNVLIITIDTLRAQQMGAYGYERNTTPFLDSLFAKGVVYETAITPAYLTFQSDASMLSGVYPSQNGITDWQRRIEPRYRLLPAVLRHYGYHAAAFVSPSLWREFGMNESFDEYVLADSSKNIAESRKNVSAYLHAKEEPFFVFWHTYDVHLPFYDAASQFYPGNYAGGVNSLKPTVPGAVGHLADINWPNQTSGRVQVREKFTLVGATGEYQYIEQNYTYSFTDEDKEYLKASYDTGIKYTDDQLRLFFEEISDEPWYNNTIIIITSEHGEDLWEHGFLFHRDLYDVNTRVPLAIIYPAKLQPARVKGPVSTLDIMPTILGLVEGTAPAEAEGVDLFAADLSARKVYTERPPFDEYSVRTAKYKYILRNPDKAAIPASLNISWFMQDILQGDTTFTDELYDVEADPGEQQNLLGQGLPIEAELRADAIAFRERMRRARQSRDAGPSTMPVFTYP